MIRMMPTLFDSTVKLHSYLEFFTRDENTIDDPNCSPLKFETMLHHQSLEIYSNRKFNLQSKFI
jgi:hypothetical protein